MLESIINAFHYSISPAMSPIASDVIQYPIIAQSAKKAMQLT